MEQFARPIWETDEDCLTARVKQLENEIHLGKELMTASRLMVDAALNDMETKDAEITRLKEQLARTERERDQATTWLIIDEKGEIWSRARGQWARVGNKDTDPDLYAHLAGKVEG